MFLWEIKTKSDFARICFDRLYLLTKDVAIFGIPHFEGVEMDQQRYLALTFEAITSYLHNVSSVALVLFPITPPFMPTHERKRKQVESRINRGRHMRNLLQVSDDHLFSSRAFRNHLAHTDERIDDWWENSPNRGYMRMNLQPMEALKVRYGTRAEVNIFENFDPMNGHLHFRGDSYDLPQSIASLIELQSRASELLERKRP